MIDGLKPYPEYKDSGSRWLGNVPVSWEVRNLRTLIGKRTERERPDLPLLSVAREKGVFVRSLTDEDENHNVIPEDLSNYKVARAGNLVINKMKAWQGSMGIAPCDGIVSPAYFVFDFQIANHRFGQTLLRSKPYVAHFGQASDGVRVGQWDLSMTGMRQIPILIPDASEQDAIVRFLDHANGRIERAIRAKQKMMALLNEQKQAIIHRAVTRGLNPNVPLKPSGIPWLGDIPKHWEMRRIKQTASILRGIFTHRPRNDPSLYDGPYPFIQTGAVARAAKFITSYKQTLNEKGLAVSKLFPSGTLCMTIAANIGDVAILNFEACFPDSIVGLIPHKGMERDYFFFVLRCMKQEFLLEAPVNTQGNLNVNRIGAMSVPRPPREEQVQIVRHIETETKSSDAAAERTEREIGLLREYRTRLVADVVTGKLDVRAAARHLPAESAEPETAIAVEEISNGDQSEAVDE
jgi:type I restriction enzyme S subunit